jgi:hypothetical protein
VTVAARYIRLYAKSTPIAAKATIAAKNRMSALMASRD